MEQSLLRAWWSRKQGLDGSLMGQTPAAILAATGWARSVGGVGPYLTLFARGGISRKAVDDACAEVAIHELPSARGCTYVVPADDYALALKASQGFGDDSDIANAKRYCGFTDKEFDKLKRGVLDALAKQAMEPRELREVLGSLVRPLGDEGKKRGLTTTLPMALGALQSVGEIRRQPINGRLDQQRYRYALWRDCPLKKQKLSNDDARRMLAERYFRWIGPASLAQFKWFCQWSVKEIKAAVDQLDLVSLEPGDDRLMFAADRDALSRFKPPAKPQFALVSGIDGLVLLRRDLAAVLDARDAAVSVFVDKGRKPMGGLADLPSHGIFDRGRLIGLWEFDIGAQRIVWATFAKSPPGLKKEVERVEAFVRDELGDARSFSLDSAESRAPRIAELAKGF